MRAKNDQTDAEVRPRRIFSVVIQDADLEHHIKVRSSIHPSGFTGYFLDLVKADLTKWQSGAIIRAQALTKLTDSERAAFGFQQEHRSA